MARRPAARRLSVSAVLGLLITLLMVVPAIPASAHATLLESTPSDGTLMDQGPATVTLRYDQPVGVSAGSVKVLAPNGSRVDSGDISQSDGGRVVVDRLPSGLAPGTYTVLWRVLSADTHSVFGATTFSVKTVSGDVDAAAAAEAEQANGGSAAENLLSVSRLVFYAGLVLLVGGGLFVFVLWPGGAGVAAVRRMLWIGWATSAAGTVGGLLMQGPYSQGLGLYYTFDPELIALVLPTRFGVTSLVRLVLLAGTAVVLVGIARRRRLRTAAAAVLGLGLLASTSAVGHAGSGDLAGLAFPADVLHLAAASAWIGGLILLAAVLLRRPPAALARILPRWSRYAECCVALLVVTGTFAAWREVREWGAITTTGYGRLLLIKVALVAVILVFGAMGRARIHRRYRPAAAVPERIDTPLPTGGSGRPTGVLLQPGAVLTTVPVAEVATAPLARLLRRTVLVEGALAVVVLAVTAVLVSTTPARESYFPVFSGAATVTGDLQLRVEVTPARVGLNDMSVSYAAATGKAADVVQVTGRWTLQSGGTVVPVTLVRTAAGHYSLRHVQLPDVGTWQLAIDTQTSDIDTSTNLFTVRIR